MATVLAKQLGRITQRPVQRGPSFVAFGVDLCPVGQKHRIVEVLRLITGIGTDSGQRVCIFRLQKKPNNGTK